MADLLYNMLRFIKMIYNWLVALDLMTAKTIGSTSVHLRTF